MEQQSTKPDQSEPNEPQKASKPIIDWHRFFSRKEVIQQLATTQTLIQKSQQRLIRSLKRKFGEVPDEIVIVIEQTNDEQQLDEWMDEFVDVDTLEEMTFSAA